MEGDRNWMYGSRYVNKRMNPTFVKGVESFFEYAFSIQENIISGDRIKCPCAKCGCTRWLDKETIGKHLMKSGFRLFYEKWFMHGEEYSQVEQSQPEQSQTEEQEKGREPRWSDELFQPTHTKKKTGEYITGKAKDAQKYGEDRNTWPAYDGDVWYSTGISDQNAHGDNYGLGALGKTRRMFRSSGSSSSQSHSSQSYSSMPPAPQLTEEYIDMISARVLDRMEDRFMSKITELFRASQGGSGSQHASIPAPQDDEDDNGDDDEGQGSDDDGDGTT